jgi:4-amino-4-deoxychorismate lyase
MILVNGAPAESLPATDRGLAYGDGVFRTLRAQNGEPLHWARHYAKLAVDCAALSIPCPDEAPLLHESRTVASEHAQSVVKIMVTRGSGVRGYAPPAPCEPRRIVMGSAFAQHAAAEAGIHVHLCRLRLAHQPALAGVKHLNRLENVLARAEWNDAAFSEGLLLDQQGFAISGTMSNVFVVEQGVLRTPELSRCGVAGVTRARVMEIAQQLNIAVQVEALPLARVLAADEVFFVNSVIGLWPVARLGERTWPSGRRDIALEIRAALEATDAA